MKLNRPHTLEDVIHRATLFIEIEEEKATIAKKHMILKDMWKATKKGKKLQHNLTTKPLR